MPNNLPSHSIPRTSPFFDAKETSRQIDVAGTKDLITVMISAMAPAWQIGKTFLNPVQSLAIIPLTITHLLSAASLLQAYLKQTHADAVEQFNDLQREIAIYQTSKSIVDEDSVNIELALSSLIDAHYDVLESLENQLALYSDVSEMHPALKVQTKISETLRSLSILSHTADFIKENLAHQTIPDFRDVLDQQMSHAQKAMADLVWDIQHRESGLLAVIQKVDLPTHLISPMLLLGSLGMNYWYGANVIQLLDQGLEIGFYWGITYIAQSMTKAFAYMAYLNDPPAFKPQTWARLTAAMGTSASIVSPKVTEQIKVSVTHWIEDLSGVQRVSFQELDQKKANAHTEAFLQQGPQLKIQLDHTEHPILVVDKSGNTIPLQTTPDAPEIIKLRAQWHHCIGDITYYFYVSARGILYVTPTPDVVNSQPRPFMQDQANTLFTQTSESVITTISTETFLNFGLAVAAYASPEPIRIISLVGLLLFSRARAVEAVPSSNRNTRMDFYKNYFQKTVLISSLQAQIQSIENEQSDPDFYFQSFVNNFQMQYDPTSAITQMYPALSGASSQHLNDESSQWKNALISNLDGIKEQMQSFWSTGSLLDQFWDHEVESSVYSGETFVSNNPAIMLQLVGNIMEKSGEVMTDDVATAEIGIPDWTLGDVLKYLGKSMALTGDIRDAGLIHVKSILNSATRNHQQSYDDTVATFGMAVCNYISSASCEAYQQRRQLWNEATRSGNANPTAAIHKSMTYASQQIADARTLIREQQLSMFVQQAEYQNALKGISDSFNLASTIAVKMGDPQAAAEIQAIGMVSLNFMKAFHAIFSASKMFSTVIGDISTITSILGPVSAVVNVVSSIVSLFGGGSGSADQAILNNQRIIIHNQKIIIQQLQGLCNEMSGLIKEVRKGFDEVFNSFNELFKNLVVILGRIAEGEEITQEIGQQLQNSILQLEFQLYYSFKNVLEQKFVADLDRLSIVVRAGLSPADPAVQAEFVRLARAYYEHAVPDASVGAVRRGAALMVAINSDGTQQSTMQAAEADKLDKLPTPEFIAYYASGAQKFISTPLPRPVNLLMWLDASNAYANLVYATGSNPPLYAKQELTAMIKEGINLLQFAKEVGQSTRLFKHLFNLYNTSVAQWGSNASGIVQQAWQGYTENDPAFHAEFVMLLQQKMTDRVSKIQNFQYDTTLFDEIFPKWNYFYHGPKSKSLNDVISDSIGQDEGYVTALVNRVSQYSVAQALKNLFKPSNSSAPKYPCIAFGTDPQTGPIDVTDVVTVPHHIILGEHLGILEISFSYAIVYDTYPSIIVTGNYTHQNGDVVRFFEGKQPFTPAQQLNDMLANVPGVGTPPTPWIFNPCNNPFTDVCTVHTSTGITWQLSPFIAPPTGSTLWNWQSHSIPIFIFHIFDCPKEDGYLTEFQSLVFGSSEVQKIYLHLSTALYNAVLVTSWNKIYANVTAPLLNTHTWDPVARVNLVSQTHQELTTISQTFFQTMLQNNNMPGYAVFTNGLQAINAAYNKLRGFCYFPFPNHMQGIRLSNATSLCVPVNPWRANGTSFRVKDGVQFTAKQNAAMSTMESVSAILLRQHETRIVWSPLNTSQATIGLMIGNRTIANFTQEASSTTPTYYTQINAINATQVEVITATQSFYDEGGHLINQSRVNVTEPSAVIRAFVQFSKGEQQGIQIHSATSRQHNTTVKTASTDWVTLNAPKSTTFSNTEMTFYGVNQSDPLGWTKVETNQTIGMMNSEVYVVWQANSDNVTAKSSHNFTVSIDFGQQKGIATFLIDAREWNTSTWYYSRLTVTPDQITCVTCENNFDDRGGDPLYRIQHHVSVPSFAPIAVRISQANGPVGTQSVTLKSIQVVGFTASILPEPMQPNQWTVKNRTQPILTSPEGISIENNASHSSPTTLTSQYSTHWQHKEIWLKWKTQGRGAFTLQLANQTIPTFISTQDHEDWIYTRIVIFDRHVNIYTAKGNYDLNKGSFNINQTTIPISVTRKGGLSWLVQAQSTESVLLTVGECIIQNAITTIFSQMLQNNGLMNRDALIHGALNATSPTVWAEKLQTLMRAVDEFKEVTLAQTQSGVQDLDPRIIMTLQRLNQALLMVIANGFNLTLSNARSFEDITLTQSRSRSRTPSPSRNDKRDRSASKSKTVIPHDTVHDSQVAVDRSNEHLIMMIAISGWTTSALILITACVCMKNRHFTHVTHARRSFFSDRENDRGADFTERTELDPLNP